MANEIKLLKASLDGDTAAFEKIVEKYQSLICAITFSGTGRVDLSEEFAQETFVRAWTNLKQLRDISGFRAWISSIARNLLCSYYREKKCGSLQSSDTGELEDTTPNPSEILIAREENLMLEDAITKMPADYSEPLIMYYRQGKSTRQVAGSMGLNESTVRTRLQRARQMLREDIAKRLEDKLEKSGPGKVFTKAVMAAVGSSIVGSALIGEATAAAGEALAGGANISATASAGAAGSAAGTSGSAATGLSAVFSTAAAKVVTAAAIAVIAVGAAVVYNNTKSQPAEQNNPVAVREDSPATITEKSDKSGEVENSGNENIASLKPAESIVEPVKTIPVVAAADTTAKPKETAPQYVDPNKLENIYLAFQGIQKDGTIKVHQEHWFKKPDLFKVDTKSLNTTMLFKGNNKLVFDHKNATAQFSNTGDAKPHNFSDMLYSLIRIGLNIISARQTTQGLDKSLLNGEEFEFEYELVPEKTTDKVKVFFCSIQGQDDGMEYFIDPQTGLVQKVVMQSKGNPETIVYFFDYSAIPLDVFSMKVPEGYKKLSDRMPPKFQGWIYDNDVKPVANADIYLRGQHGWGYAKGKSGPDGEFDFNIPVGDIGPNKSMSYPVLVHAVSKDHPGYVAWTVIDSPLNKSRLPGFIPNPSDVFVEEDNGQCLAVNNVVLVMEPAATISGKILDNIDGRPIKDVKVSFLASVWGEHGHIFDTNWGKGDKGVFEVKTDSEGYYIFDSLPGFAWPEELVEEGKKAAKERDPYGNSIAVTVRAIAEGYQLRDIRFTLKPGDSISDKVIDYTLYRTGVTVTGRVVDNYGKPLVGYPVYHCIPTEGDEMVFTGYDIRTDEKGWFQLDNCVYDSSVSIKVGANRKPHRWDENKLTKNRKFEYFADKYVPLPFKEGVYEYDIDIVVDRPELEYEFYVHDTAGNPIAGMSVEMRWPFTALGSEWSEKLKGTTDSSGKCVISGLPKMDHANFTVNSRGRQKKYRSVFSSPIKLRPDEKGYFFDVTVPKTNEKFDRDNSVRTFDSKGKQIDL